MKKKTLKQNVLIIFQKKPPTSISTKVVTINTDPVTLNKMCVFLEYNGIATCIPKDIIIIYTYTYFFQNHIILSSSLS
jgi:hypothetical protein